MTNKEYMKEQIEEVKKDLESGKRLKSFPTIFMDRKLLDRYESIFKDLETLEQYEAIFKEPMMNIQKRLKVLEILKEKAFLYVNDVNKDVKSIQIVITTCDDRFKQVEEWLENGK